MASLTKLISRKSGALLPRLGCATKTLTRNTKPPDYLDNFFPAKRSLQTASVLQQESTPYSFNIISDKEEQPLDIEDIFNKRPRFVGSKNGSKVPSVFTELEYMRRLAKLREYMVANDVGSVVFTSYHNVNYYSGFLYTAFGRPYGLVVTLDKCTTLSAGIDGGQPWRRSYGEAVTYTDWHRDNFYLGVKKILGDIPGNVGIEYDHLSLENAAKMEDILPNKHKVDIGAPSMKLRMYKSPEEIQVIREGARIADIGGAAVVEAVHEGVREYEVAMHSTQTMVREIAKTFPTSDIMDTWTWFQSGINTDGAHNPLTTRKVRKGDILSLNCFPMIAGYYTALERTMFLDHASDEHLKYWEMNCDIHKKGLDLIKPGVTCSEIANKLNEMYEENDLLQYRSFGYGHSFGTLCHYFGREAELELREDIHTVLEPGMVISMEPMINIPWGKPGCGGYREHDILIVNDKGAENITKFPYGPQHNIIKK